jgi:hypothetical protein
VTISQIAAKGRLPELVKGCADDQYCQEVLRFLGWHPHTRFSRLTIIHALNGYRWGTERALNQLTDAGLVKRSAENGVTLYLLSGDGWPNMPG